MLTVLGMNTPCVGAMQRYRAFNNRIVARALVYCLVVSVVQADCAFDVLACQLWEAASFGCSPPSPSAQQHAPAAVLLRTQAGRVMPMLLCMQCCLVFVVRCLSHVARNVHVPAWNAAIWTEMCCLVVCSVQAEDLPYSAASRHMFPGQGVPS